MLPSVGSEWPDIAVITIANGSKRSEVVSMARIWADFLKISSLTWLIAACYIS